MKAPNGKAAMNRPVFIQEDAMPEGFVMPNPLRAAAWIGVTVSEVLDAIASGDSVSAPRRQDLWFCDWATQVQIDQAKAEEAIAEFDRTRRHRAVRKGYHRLG